MATRPLPPGRRGRGGRAMPSMHLPEVKILSDVPSASAGVTSTSSYVEQLRAQQEPTASVEPEHESTAKKEEEEDETPTPVRSVKAFVLSLENVHDAAPPVRVAAAAGEDARPSARPAVQEPVYPAAPVAQRLFVEEPKPVVVSTVTATPTPSQPFAPQPDQRVLTPLQPLHADAGPRAAAPVSVTASPAAPAVDVPSLEGFHPFKIVLPIYSVPEIPETVDCVYDDAALEMQKNIMKAVKKVFGKDRTKLEDFKINSRLYGNNFMDPLEYVESLVKDLGGNRALLLVPCLVSIQPDFMKRSSLLVATRNYRLRNLAKLEFALDTFAVEAPAIVQAPPTHTMLTPEVAVAAFVTDPTAAPLSAPNLVDEAVEVAHIADADGQESIIRTNLHDEEPESKPEGTVTNENDSFVAPSKTAETVKEVYNAEEPAETIVPPAVEEVPTEMVTEVRTVKAACNPEEPAETMVPPAADGVPTETITEAQPQPILAVPEPDVYAVSEPIAYAISEPKQLDAVLVEPTKPLNALPVASIACVEPAQGATPILEPIVTLDRHEVPASFNAPAQIAVSSVNESSNHETYVVANGPQGLMPTTPSSTTAMATVNVEPSTSVLTIDTTVSSECSSLSSAGSVVTPSDVSPLQHQPVRRKSTLNLFGEDIGDDDDDDDDDGEGDGDLSKTNVDPQPITEHSPLTTGAATPPQPSPSSFLEAESLFGEVISVVVKPAAESPASAPAPVPVATKPPPARMGMLFGFAPAGGDSDSDSDSEFSD